MTFDPTETAPRLPRVRAARRVRYLTQVHPVVHPPMRLDRALVFGRQPGPKGLRLDDTRASRAHAEVAPVRGEHDVFRLRDLGSKNGTFLDGQRVESEYLHGSAVIRAGDSILVFTELELDGASVPPSPGQGGSPRMARLAERVARVGRADLPVLVRGPSGAGKERLSQQLHAASGRRGPLVAINCATFGADLLASELFGHVRGAFSGANTARQGLFVAARGGTLFLDEIAELPLEQQPALLRALQEGRVRPVGADREVEVDVRVVAASHQDLRALVDAGRFRGDLYARLAGVELTLPGLAERREEILPLFRHFLGPGVEVGPEAAEALLLHDWPFNVRELQHLARGLRVELDGGRVTLDRLPAPVQAALHAAATPAVEAAPLDRAALEALLGAHQGNVSAAARAVGQSRQQLYRRLRALGVDPTVFRPDAP